MLHRILFTLPTLLPTTSKLPRILEICGALDQQAFEPYVSVDHKGRLHPDGLVSLQRSHVQVWTIRMTPSNYRRFKSFLDMLYTIYFLRRHKITIQHSFDYSRWWFEPILAKLGGVKYWITTKANMDCNGFHWRVRLGLADYIIAQSEEMRDLILSKIPAVASKIVIIPNGVDTEVYQPHPEDTQIIETLGLDSCRLILGCVAHLVPDKDHPSLLKAFANSAKRNQVELLLIGENTYSSAYNKEISDLIAEFGLEKHVHLLGLRKDVVQLFSIMDGAILTSCRESLSNAVLQGMACGLPIISSDVGGMPSAVRNGVNGWLVHRGENFISELSAAIDEWASNAEMRKAYGLASREIICNEFSRDQMVRNHIRLYETLLA